MTMVKRPWDDRNELEVLQRNSRLPSKVIRDALRISGYERTESAIDGQLRKMGLSMHGDRTHADRLPEVDNLPERCDRSNHMVLTMPSTATEQVWQSKEHPVRVRMTRSSPEMAFDEVWTSTLRPGCKFGSYALLRAVLSPAV